MADISDDFNYYQKHLGVKGKDEHDRIFKQGKYSEEKKSKNEGVGYGRESIKYKQ